MVSTLFLTPRQAVPGRVSTCVIFPAIRLNCPLAQSRTVPLLCVPARLETRRDAGKYRCLKGVPLRPPEAADAPPAPPPSVLSGNVFTGFRSAAVPISA